MDVDDEECECDSDNTIADAIDACDIRSRSRLDVIKKVRDTLDTGRRRRWLVYRGNCVSLRMYRGNGVGLLLSKSSFAGW